jgi:hypothetical protein
LKGANELEVTFVTTPNPFSEVGLPYLLFPLDEFDIYTNLPYSRIRRCCVLLNPINTSLNNFRKVGHAGLSQWSIGVLIWEKLTRLTLVGTRFDRSGRTTRRNLRQEYLKYPLCRPQMIHRKQDQSHWIAAF